MTPYRKAIEKILVDKVRVVTIDTEKEFIYLDKTLGGEWRLTITKSLYEEQINETN